jgi:hypothetical protein
VIDLVVILPISRGQGVKSLEVTENIEGKHGAEIQKNNIITCAPPLPRKNHKSFANITSFY